MTHELLPRILGDPRPEMKCAALEICEALGSVGAELVDGIVESASCPDDLVRQRTVPGVECGFRCGHFQQSSSQASAGSKPAGLEDGSSNGG